MQKKILTTIVIFIISIFISVTSVSAATRLVFSENSNGNVKATLHFEDGFIGGFDITLKYSGDVKYKQLNLDSKLKNSHVEYNNNTHIINIKFTTGGVGTSHNLLNKNKELVLGDILFDTSSKSNVSYKIECTSLTVVGNDWNSKNVEPELENNELTFKVNSSTEDKDNDKDDNKDDDKDNNQSSGNNNGSSNNGSSGNNSSSGSSSGSSSNNSNSGNSSNNTNNNNSSSGSSNNQSANDKENSSSESNGSNSGNNSSSENNNTTNDNDEEADSNEQTNNSTEDSDEESKSTKIVEIILGIALVGIAGTICFLAIKPKNVKTDK